MSVEKVNKESLLGFVPSAVACCISGCSGTIQHEYHEVEYYNVYHQQNEKMVQVRKVCSVCGPPELRDVRKLLEAAKLCLKH